MKSQQKRATATSSAGGAQQLIQNLLPEQKNDEKNNFSKAVALLIAQKQRKAGVLTSHKNSLPENVMNLSQDYNSLQNHTSQISNNSTSATNSHPLSSKLNQSLNKGCNQQFHLPQTNNNQNQLQSQLVSHLHYQKQNYSYNQQNSLNKSNMLDTSCGNFQNQTINSIPIQNQQQQTQQYQQLQSFSGQKNHQKNNYDGGILQNMNSSTQNGNIGFQQTRPSQAQQKLNLLLDQTAKIGKQSPTRIAATEQSVQTINSSFNGNQKQCFNNSFQGLLHQSSVQNQQQNPLQTMQFYQYQKSNGNTNILNKSNNPGQISHTLQDTSPIRKTRQSLELRQRPLLTEGNVSTGQNAQQYSLFIKSQYQIQKQQQEYLTTCSSLYAFETQLKAICFKDLQTKQDGNSFKE